VSAPAQSRLVRVRTSDAVVEHILNLLFAGELRTGDRIDLDGLAATLGVSRVPIREALAQLERDGIISIPHHRGAFVENFDAATLREAFELYALLSGLTSGRVATSRDRQVIDALSELHDQIGRVRDIDRFELHAGNFRRVINLAAGGPHLRALMRTFRGLVPAAAKIGMKQAMAQERIYITAEFDAIRRGSAATASRVAIEHVRYSGACAIDSLIAKGVFAADAAAENPAHSTAASGDLVRLIKTMGGS
jgi:DNA-binding GntR family transcriptional regulator